MSTETAQTAMLPGHAPTPEEDYWRQREREMGRSSNDNLPRPENIPVKPKVPQAKITAVTPADLWISEELNKAGGRKMSGSDEYTGAVYQSGRFKGKTKGQAFEALKQEARDGAVPKQYFDEARKLNESNGYYRQQAELSNSAVKPVEGGGSTGGGENKESGQSHAQIVGSAYANNDFGDPEYAKDRQAEKAGVSREERDRRVAESQAKLDEFNSDLKTPGSDAQKTFGGVGYVKKLNDPDDRNDRLGEVGDTEANQGSAKPAQSAQANSAFEMAEPSSRPDGDALPVEASANPTDSAQGKPDTSKMDRLASSSVKPVNQSTGFGPGSRVTGENAANGYQQKRETPFLQKELDQQVSEVVGKVGRKIKESFRVNRESRDAYRRKAQRLGEKKEEARMSRVRATLPGKKKTNAEVLAERKAR